MHTSHLVEVGLYDEAALGHGLQLVRCHEGPLHHLKRLAWIILSPADGAAHDCAAAQGLGQLLGSLGGRSEAAEDIHLTVVHDDLRALLAIVLLKLAGDGLDDWHQHQSTGAGGGEHELQ